MNFKYKGYSGKYLVVDLSRGKIAEEQLKNEFAFRYIGGTGFCSRILWDEVNHNVDPLGPENLLIIATGPLTGTMFPPSGRYMIAGRSPLTGIWGEAHAGGHFGPELKFAGFDMIIFKGTSEKPKYLHVEDDRAELIDASELWGKNTLETTDQIREELDDENVKVACIGQAGENLVKYAAVIDDYYRAAGRTGLGAVMGSKKLKAVAVRGTKAVTVSDPEGFYEIVEEAFKMCTSGKWGEAAKQSLGTYGTTNLVPAMNYIGRLPTKNHWTGVYPDYEKIGPILLKRKYMMGRDSCFGCAINCKFMSYVPSGPYKNTLTSGPEYETIVSFGSNCLNDDMESIIHANMLCNQYGLDTISTGKVISFAMECYEHKILREDDVDGVKLTWGNQDAIITLIHKIAKREGFGNLLVDGVRVAAKKLGKDAEKYAIHVNGLEVSGQDGRAHKSIGLTHAISVRGADHLRSLCTVDELGYTDIAAERFGEENVKEICDLLSENKKGMIVKDQEDFFTLVDSLIICKYGTMWPPIYYFDFVSKLLPPLTGMKEYSNVSMLRQTAERISNLRRCFNVREGYTRKNDQLHPRFTEEAMPEGPAKGHTVKLDGMLDEYYEFRGWDKQNGLPFRSTLKKLGLSDVAEELSLKGKVIDD